MLQRCFIVLVFRIS